MNKMKQETKKLSQIYFIILLALGLVIIFESVTIVNTLKIRESLLKVSPIIPKIAPPIETKRGKMEILLEENQKIIPYQNLKAKIIFDSKGEPVGGIDAILSFDPKAISIVNISLNREIFSQIVINNQKQEEGRIKITAYQPTKNLTQEEKLASITFRLLQKQPTTLGLEFLGTDVVTDSNLVSQKSQKDILGSVKSLNLSPEIK
jgi:hypothetical protein